MTIDLEVPGTKGGGEDLESEYIPGMSWKIAYAVQEVFDNFLNFAIVRHCIEAGKWVNKDSETAQYIAQKHNIWAEMLRNAENTMKIEEIK